MYVSSETSPTNNNRYKLPCLIQIWIHLLEQYLSVPLKTCYTEIKYKICAKLSNSQKNKISTHLTSCTASINMYSSVAFSKVMLNHYCCMFWRNKFVKTQEINNFSRDLKAFRHTVWYFTIDQDNDSHIKLHIQPICHGLLYDWFWSYFNDFVLNANCYSVTYG